MILIKFKCRFNDVKSGVNKFFCLLMFSLMVNVILAQVPQLVHYQAVARDAVGVELINQELVVRFTLRQGNPTGVAVWQEVQNVVTNSAGLFDVNLGEIEPFTMVDWANSNKFIQLEIDFGSGFVELGVQQLMSVPYSITSGNGIRRVSETGDSLILANGEHLIIPGISLANRCGIEYILNPNLSYGVVYDHEGRGYKTIAIGTQEWMAENLNTGTYRNGDLITTNLNADNWENTTSGACAYYDNDRKYSCPYGRLYNWYACVDSRQLCPIGWHVPSDEDWDVLINYLGGPDVAGGKLKSTGTYFWAGPNDGASNLSGFNGIPGGRRQFNFYNRSIHGFWWSTTSYDASNAWNRRLNSNINDTYRDSYPKYTGFSVRCLRD
jgi:uncharacterized protein (TIGR02145 family)